MCHAHPIHAIPTTLTVRSAPLEPLSKPPPGRHTAIPSQKPHIWPSLGRCYLAWLVLGRGVPLGVPLNHRLSRGVQPDQPVLSVSWRHADAFSRFHGMEEVEGSSPSRSTNLLNNLELLDYARPGLGPREYPREHLRRRHFVRLASPVGALLPRIPFSDLTCHG